MRMENSERLKREVLEASPEDAESIFKVQEVSWMKTYPNEGYGITAEMLKKRFENKEGRIARWKSMIEAKSDAVWVVKEDSVVIGFCGIKKTEEEHRLASIYIDPEKQGGGVGSILITKAIAYLGREKDIVLDVVSYNENAIRFYIKHGFEVLGPTPTEDLVKIGDKALPEIRMVLKAL